MSGVNKERNVPEVENYDLNHSEYYVNSLPLSADSSLLVNLSDGFGPEENLRTRFKGFTSADEDRLYNRQDVNTNILFEKVKVLSARQKKAVVSLVKSQNGVIPIRKKNPKVVLYFQRLVQAQSEAPTSATRSILQRIQLQSKMEGKGLGGEGQIGEAGKLIESREEPEKSIPIAIPIKISEEEVILEDAMENENDEQPLPYVKQNSKRKQSESVMPPFKYPKMVEYSFEKTFPNEVGIKNPNDYGFNGKKEQKGASSWSPHSSFMMGVASPASVTPQFEGKLTTKDITMNLSRAVKNPNKTNMGKEVAIPIQKGNRQCSIGCEGRGGKIPNLECIKCRCLVHSECAGIPDLISSSSFICPNCHQLYLERKKAETAGFPMKRVSSPCPRMIPMPPTYSSSSPQNPRIFSQSFPRPGTGDRNMMLISLLNERSLPNKIPRYHPRVARLARAPLNILSPPKPFWMIRGPSTSAPNYQLERGTSTVLSSQSFGQIRPPAPAPPSSHCRFVYSNKTSIGKAPPPPPLRSFATPVKIAPRPNPTVLDCTNPTNCQLILSLLRCPPPALEPVPGKLQASRGGSGASWSSPNLSSSLTSPSIFKVPRGRPPLAVNKSARGRAPNLISSSSSLPELGGTYGGVTITKVSARPPPPPPQQRDSQSMYNRLQERLQTMMMDQQRLPLPVQTPTTIPSQFGEANNTLENLENEEEEQVDVIRMPRSGITLKIVKKRKIIEDDGNRNGSPTLPSSPRRAWESSDIEDRDH